MIESVGSHQLAEIARDNGLEAQSDHKKISDGAGEDEAIKAFRVPQAGVIQVEAASFQIRNERLNVEA